MAKLISGIMPYKPEFPDYLNDYIEKINEAKRQNKHHDYRRQLFLNFLRKGFDVDPVEVLIEEKIKVDEVRGRIDALFNSTIFEFKIDLKAEHPAALLEIKKYFESRERPDEYFAVLTDGLSFEIFQYSGNKPVSIGEFKLDDKKQLYSYVCIDQILFTSKPASPKSEDISTRFGPHSAVFNQCRKIIGALFSQVEADTRVKVKMKEWDSLLARVYGEGLGDKDLFIRHTYLSTFSRLLIAKALYPNEKRKINDYLGLLNGDYFVKKALYNVAEPDFFSWAAGTPVEHDFIGFMAKLEAYLSVYNLANITEDILKEIYQDLIGPESRHSLGEYYTPDWIADRSLDLLKYSEGVVLDPACGSGSFLVAVIRRFRSQKIKGNRLIKQVIKSVVGIDVHPLAVIMTKANILLGIAEELKAYKESIHLPIYMADSLLLTEDPKLKAIKIPVTSKESFFIPLESIRSGLDMDKFLDEMTEMAEQAAVSENLHSSANDGLKKKLFKELSETELHYWRQNFNLLAKLIKTKRDTVWKFILKNAYKPAYLRNKKVDYVIGNPPWLSYRYIKDAEYKTRVKELTIEYELLKGDEVKLFTQMDTSTLFFIHSMKHFLKSNGSIAFVLPKTTILPAKQHTRFQKIGFSQIHDFTDVTPLFNVRAILLIRQPKDVKTSGLPVTLYSARLPKKNMEWKEANFYIKTDESKWDFLHSGIQSQYYYERFFQGATIVPRCFWFVQIDESAKFDQNSPYLETSSEAEEESKEQWRMKINGRIEKKFIYHTVLAKGLIPFAITRKELVFLPMIVGRDKNYMVDAGALLEDGKVNASKWMSKLEKLWNDKNKNLNIGLLRRLDYSNTMTNQLVKAPIVLIYNTSGTNLTASLYITDEEEQGKIKSNGFIADAKTYYYYPENVNEGDYLCAFLNSNIVNEMIKAFQPQGLYGPRDIHRRPFEVCAIPQFDSKNENHKLMAKLGKTAREKMNKIAPQMKGRLGRVRTDSKKLIKDEISKIDKLAAQILNEQGQKLQSQTKMKKTQNSQDDLFKI